MQLTKVKYFKDKVIVQMFGLPVWEIHFVDKFIKLYCLKIRVCKIDYEQFEQKQLNSLILDIKTIELLNSRENIQYEV